MQNNGAVRRYAGLLKGSKVRWLGFLSVLDVGTESVKEFYFKCGEWLCRNCASAKY